MLASHFRAELGIDGCPGVFGTHALIDYLYPQVRLRPDPDPCAARCAIFPTGRGVVWAPRDDAWRLNHELGHLLFKLGVAAMLRLEDQPHGAAWLREEWGAEEWAVTWLIPAEVLWLPDWEAAELSGCPVEAVARRRHDLLYR